MQCTRLVDMTSGTITVAQAAKILGKSRWTVWRMCRDGDLIAEKLEGETSPWLLNRADVERRARRLADQAKAAS